jgi:hypothetical protein
MCALPTHGNPDYTPQNLDGKPQRVVADVEKVVLGVQVRRLTSPVHLLPNRAHFVTKARDEYWLSAQRLEGKIAGRGASSSPP